MSSSTSDWEPPLPEDLQRMLPQYEITGIIGRGGMGAVYKGRQAKLDRTVAIKVLRTNRAERDSLPPGSPAGVSAGAAGAKQTATQGENEMNFVKRFEQEAQAMARLDHPAIVSVYDFGETAEGLLYFVMEFIDGMDIQQYLKSHGGKLPQESALTICAHVLDALGYAHDHGIVHRDIKPANILLNREGRVKIADFGLAKKFGEHGSAPALTMSNMAVGTPDFVAPEALDPDLVADHRADLYAVGVMLYQMLTGKLPRGNYRLPSELSPEIDPRLDDMVGKAMEANPDYRYASAAALRADLDAVLSQPIIPVEPGTESDEVPAAVPVTLTVKGGGGRVAPVPTPAKGGRTGLIIGLMAAAALVIGFGVYAAFGPDRGNAVPPGNTEGKGKGLTTEGAEITEAGTKMPAPNPSPVPSVANIDPPAPTKAPVTPPVPPTAVPPAPEVKTPAPATPVPPSVAKNDPPTPTPAPVTTPEPPVSTPPTQTPPPASVPAPAAEPSPTVARLASLPGLKTRLDGYLAARRTQTGDLAGKYLGGLQTRLDQAANAGDLKLATAYTGEKTRVESVQKALATPPGDALAAATDVSVAMLPPLPDGSPEPLVALRQTWTTESGKIRTMLDAALQQSLQSLEAELTKARDFETAQAVLAYREALGKPATGASVAAVTPGVPTPVPAGATPAAKPGVKDLTLSLATKEKPFVNTLGMKFVPVPDTDVLFCIHEVRWKDYAAYATENSAIDKAWQNQTFDGFKITERPEDHPVVSVSWEDAQAYCAWLSKKEGKTYRLPTDREWSVAAGIGRDEKRAADTTPEMVFKPQDAFPWGDHWPPPKGADNYSDESRKEKAPSSDPNVKYLGGYADGCPTTAPVMRYDPNKLGLFDLGGNVREWCEDWYSNEKKARVLRGGSWDNGARDDLASSRRRNFAPSIRGNSYGFRVVVETTPRLSAPSVGVPTPPSPTPTPVPGPGAASPAVKSGAKDLTLALATKEKPYENSLGMKFVPVRDTDVLFCIHEVRYKDYAAFAKDAPGVDAGWQNQTHFGFKITERPEDHPVVYVNWDDTQAYCAWLSKKEGKTYRLPTDREWGVAVGIGRDEKWARDTTPETVIRLVDIFPWGKDWPPPKGAGNFSDQSRKTKAPIADPKVVYLEGYDDGFPTTAPVMSFAPNKMGLYDLEGNLQEWLEDWYSVRMDDRAKRGGGWTSQRSDQCGSSFRNGSAPEARRIEVGFRIVVVVSGASTR